MLQFWKKSKADNEKQFATTNKTNDSFNTPTFKSTDPKLSFLASLEDEGLCDIDQFETTRKKSKLSRTLQDVLTDKSALTYFVQYMESKKASRYVMCWLDIDSLKSFISQGRESNILSPILNCQVDHDSLSVSTDCDSITTDTNSLCDDSALVTTERVVQNCTEMSVNESSLKMNSEELGTIEGKRKGRLVENAISIFKKYVAQEAVHKIMFSELIRKEVIENICDAEKVLLGNCFDKVQSSVCDVMEREYFDAFLESDYFCKYQIDVLTSMDVSLDDILHNETALFYFMEYLQQENCCNFLEFWIAATNLQQQLQNQKEFFDPIEAQNDAVVLYDKYFSLQAHCPLGLGDKVRFQVEQNICGEHGLVIDCFNLPLRLIEVILEKNFLKPFLASQLFYKYLSELINTAQSNDFVVNMENNRPLSSDCSSEKSLSTNSVFLALEINFNGTKKSKEKYTDMNIDMRHLCDPDSLWKRKHCHRLSCGRVTPLGKFETDLEPEPDKKEFTFKSVVKRFVNLDEEKKKEEMAWQVAEMIVKDITNMTLSTENSTNS